MLIGGEWVEAAARPHLRGPEPGHGRGHRPGAGRGRGGRRPRRARGAARLRRRLARRHRPGARPRPLPPRGGHPRTARRGWPSWRRSNCGKPIVESEFDIDDAATCFEYYGGLATKLHGEVLPVPDNALSLALREPIGVAGQIIPWNYPLLMAAWKLAPALCAGCTMVIKPAEQTPLTLLRAGPRPSRTAACPQGVVNVVTGFGESRGRAARGPPGRGQDRLHGQPRGRQDDHARGRGHPEEGQPGAGRQVARTSSSPTPTSRPRWTAPSSASSSTRARSAPRAAACWSSGPSTRRCSTRWWRRRSASSSGPGLDRATKMGPLVSQEQMERVHALPGDRAAGGAGWPCGGGRPADAGAAARLLRGAHDLLRRGQRGHHRPRGDLRAGDGGDPLRRRGGGAAHRQRHRTTAWPPRSGAATSSSACAW